jgi:hypothetical protein
VKRKSITVDCPSSKLVIDGGGVDEEKEEEEAAEEEEDEGECEAEGSGVADGFVEAEVVDVLVPLTELSPTDLTRGGDFMAGGSAVEGWSGLGEDGSLICSWVGRLWIDRCATGSPVNLPFLAGLFPFGGVALLLGRVGEADMSGKDER